MSEYLFDRAAVTRFHFTGFAFDAATGTARLDYAFDTGGVFSETLVFPGAPFALDAARERAVQAALRTLHLIAGVSYYKAAVLETIVLGSCASDADTAAFLTGIYENGLGEFAYRNGLSLRGRIHFPSSDAADAPAPALGLARHALVAIGGGKDSLVSIEPLRRLGVPQTVTWIGSAPLIRSCAERTGLPLYNISRTLAPELFAMNAQGVLNGFGQVVFSNERSASYGSLIEGTGEVNHQWSKGWDFERGFAAHAKRHIAADLNYYSLLRPFSELAVARQFAKTDFYDAHFSSCNRNFHILGERPAQRWCGVCPKCHFVFLALAPFMPKPRLMTIFGRNLLDEPAQIAGFDALLEYREHKPFECVCEGRESRAAMAALAASPSWREDAIVRRFAEEILPQLDAADLAVAPLLRAEGGHAIPADLWEPLRDSFGA